MKYVVSITITLVLVATMFFLWKEELMVMVTGEVVYSEIGGYDFKINIEEGFYTLTDTLGHIEKCNLEGVKVCIQFDSTIVFVPNNELLESSDPLSEHESNGIHYSISKTSIEILGRDYDGFMINVETPLQALYEGRDHAGWQGNFFYSFEQGIIFIHKYYKVIDFQLDQEVMKSYLLWAKNKCGLFANIKCIN